jgi:hypothetical protein
MKYFVINNVIIRVSNDWFPKKERDLAISFMSQSNYLGAGLGALIPSVRPYAYYHYTILCFA